MVLARTFAKKVLSNDQNSNLNFEKLTKKKKRGYFLSIARTTVFATGFSKDNKISSRYLVYNDDDIARTKHIASI